MDKAYAHRVGTHLSWLRKQKKLSQEQLAARMQLLGCDMTRSALAKIEVGQRMLCPDEIKALRTALSVTYDDILLYRRIDAATDTHIAVCPVRNVGGNRSVSRNVSALLSFAPHSIGSPVKGSRRLCCRGVE